ncbi:MAG: hypothetical protein JWO50_307 [Candidatus Kaiserbacteria bacterium]|nr:hypothetical protein [Candidatus Kaiserbacteria bacterium]
MSWASQRRFLYITGIIIFFAIVIGGPVLYKYENIPLTCHDGIQNQGETNIDRGGPCLILDERALLPYSIEWARALYVRDGTYNAVAYIQNPNKSAGVAKADYDFRFYDENHILLAERTGEAYIMPGGVTPIMEADIQTGNRIVAHTTFAFTNKPLIWEKMHSTVSLILVDGMLVSTVDSGTKLSAIAHNTSVSKNSDVSFVAVIFDTVGNAMSASATTVATFNGSSAVNLGFTWPKAFPLVVGSTDVLPLKAPAEDTTAQR